MIIVTGGAGFIGSNIVAALSERGADIVVCDCMGADERWRNIAKHKVLDIVEPDALFPFMDRNFDKIDAVIHMGAISSTTETNIDLIVENNLRLSIDLWEWCGRNQTRLIYASSAATYGDGDAGFEDENSEDSLARLRPLNAYGWSKHAFDRRVLNDFATGRQRPPQWAGLKFFNVYGPNEYHKGSMKSVIAQIFPDASSGNPVTLFKSHNPKYADGGQLRDFVYVNDCVDVIIWFLENEIISGLFNLGTGQARSFADLAAATFAALNQKPNIVYKDMPTEIRDRYQYFTQADMTNLRAAGYDKPFTNLEDGAADYVQNYLTAPDSYR
jgi:ADP-L-glycero-D-manno-heptose 6-epimerase